MLLYAIYVPAKVSSMNPVEVFVFASIESFVNAMEEYNAKGSTLTPAKQDYLKQFSTLARLIQWNNETKHCEKAGLVFISDNSMTDDWDGSRNEIHLVENAVDENVLKHFAYA